MGEISSTPQERTSGIEPVNEAINQMYHATQQNAASVEESAAAVDAMQDQSMKWR